MGVNQQTIADLRLNSQTVTRINTMTMQAELTSGKHFFVHKNLQELMKLLQVSKTTVQPDVKEHLNRLIDFIARDTFGSFRIPAVDVKSETQIARKPMRPLKTSFSIYTHN